jgi:hypothetical protein
MAEKIYVNATATPGYVGSEKGIPMEGDRSAWDSMNYPYLHTNDVNTSVNSIHHSLGSGSWLAAPGNHVHSLLGLGSGSSLSGQLLTSLGTGSPTWLYLTNHSHAGSAIGDGNKINIYGLLSDTATNGFVLTSNGTGSVSWKAPDSWRVGLTQNETIKDSDKTFTVPVSTEWQILWIWVEYSCSSKEGNRQLEVQLQSAGSVVIAQWQTAMAQPVSLTYKYLFGIAVQDLTSPRDIDYVTTPLPAGTFLSAGQKVRIWDNNAIDSSEDTMIVRLQYAYRSI